MASASWRKSASLWRKDSSTRFRSMNWPGDGLKNRGLMSREMPHLDARQDTGLAVNPPERARLPMAMLAERLQNSGSCFHQGWGLGQNAANSVLHLKALLRALPFRDDGPQHQSGQAGCAHERLQQQQRIVRAARLVAGEGAKTVQRAPQSNG